MGDSVFTLPLLPFRFVTLRMAPAAAPSSCPSELTTDITTGRDGCFFWSCELTSTSNTHAFTVADFAEGDLHVLELKQTNLGADARDGERNVLELDFCDGQSEAQRHLLTSLRTGRQECSKLDFPLTWTPETKLSLKLVQGSGPVCVTGNHHVTSAASREAAFRRDRLDSIASSVVSSKGKMSDAEMASASDSEASNKME